VKVDLLVGPFVANDQGDVYVYDDPEAMYSDIEMYDASTMEFFDVSGRPIRVIVEGYTWHIDEHNIFPPEPDRVSAVLRGYFARLPEHLRQFSARATAASRLADLVQLRKELESTTARVDRLVRTCNHAIGLGVLVAFAGGVVAALQPAPLTLVIPLVGFWLAIMGLWGRKKVRR
jgi:hypothetical protein